MIRRFIVALVAIVALSSSLAHAQDFVPGILKYFPGKWQAKAADGTNLFTVEWKVVADGKAIAGPSKTVAGTTGFAVAGWEPKEKKWVHVLFDGSGMHARMEVTKFADNTYFGTVYFVDAQGNVASGECRDKIIGPDHFEFTQVLNGKTDVQQWHRIKD
jgi:hypothetical protein